MSWTDGLGSPLQIAILKFFVVLLYRFPNMVVGVIRRESIGAALKCGITAQQIITYLQTNAHPEMRKQDQLVPPTVADQIRLWQMERDRLQKLSGSFFFFLFVLFALFLPSSLIRNYFPWYQCVDLLWFVFPLFRHAV